MDICHSRDEVTLIFNQFFRAPISKWMPPIHYPLTMDNTSLYPKPRSCNVTSILSSPPNTLCRSLWLHSQMNKQKCPNVDAKSCEWLLLVFHHNSTSVQSILMTIIHDNRGIRGIWAGIPLILRHVATDTKVQGGADTDNHRWIEFLKYCRKRKLDTHLDWTK